MRELAASDRALLRRLYNQDAKRRPGRETCRGYTLKQSETGSRVEAYDVYGQNGRLVGTVEIEKFAYPEEFSRFIERAITDSFAAARQWYNDTRDWGVASASDVSTTAAESRPSIIEVSD